MNNLLMPSPQLGFRNISTQSVITFSSQQAHFEYDPTSDDEPGECKNDPIVPDSDSKPAIPRSDTRPQIPPGPPPTPNTGVSPPINPLLMGYPTGPREMPTDGLILSYLAQISSSVEKAAQILADVSMMTPCDIMQGKLWEFRGGFVREMEAVICHIKMISSQCNEQKLIKGMEYDRMDGAFRVTLESLRGLPPALLAAERSGRWRRRVLRKDVIAGCSMLHMELQRLVTKVNRYTCVWLGNEKGNNWDELIRNLRGSYEMWKN